MKNLRYLLIPAIAAILVVLSACKKDFDDLEVKSDAEYAFPLFFGDLKLQKLIENSGDSISLQIDANGEMRFKYSGNVVSRTTDEIYSAIPAIPALVTDTFYGVPVKLNNNITIKKADVSAGTVFFTYKSYHTQNVTVKITIPELKKNGVAWSTSRYLPYTGNTPITDVILPISVAGYSLDIPNDTMHIRYEAVKQDGQRDTLSSFAMLVNGLKFSYMEGYFGNEVFPISRDTIHLNIYKNLLGGELYFEDPKVTVNVFNSFGFPVRSKVNIVKFKGSKGEEYDLESPYVTNGFDFGYPKITEKGKTVITSFSFDKNNSNIVPILNSSPVALDYQIDAIANPDSDPSIIGFMTDSSYFLVNVAVDLPIYGRAKNFLLEEDFSSDFGKLDGFREAEFKLLTENKLPLDATMQMYFLDANGQKLDSAFTQEQLLIEAAKVDATGLPTGVSKKETIIQFNEAQLNAVRKTKTIRVVAYVSTTSGGTVPVHINASQGLSVKMGAKAKLTNKL